METLVTIGHLGYPDGFSRHQKEEAVLWGLGVVVSAVLVYKCTYRTTRDVHVAVASNC